MPDREKVSKGLQEIVDDNWMKTHADWYVSVCSDALAILKEQEEQIDTQRRNLMILLNEPRIVRCKDCEHATITTDGEYCKYCENYTDENGDPIEVYYSANWFCAYGRKRDD